MWEIMDSKNVFVWEDRWKPSLKEGHLEHPSLVDSQIPSKVAGITDKESGEWLLNRVEQWITVEQCNAIK